MLKYALHLVYPFTAISTQVYDDAIINFKNRPTLSPSRYLKILLSNLLTYLLTKTDRGSERASEKWATLVWWMATSRMTQNWATINSTSIVANYTRITSRSTCYRSFRTHNICIFYVNSTCTNVNRAQLCTVRARRGLVLS